jgi:HSP20 family protein
MNIVLRRNGGQTALVPFFRPLSLFDDIDRLAEQMWDSWAPFNLTEGRVPSTDMYEEKDELVMKTELPGIEKKDLSITLEGDRLTIAAEKKEEEVEDAEHHTRERYYGRYYRSVTLPYPVKEEKISATLDNGVLELRLPKADEAKPRKIEVKAQLPQGEAKKKQRKTTEKKS